MICFDPDNGLEIAAKPYGRKDSSKYLYWCEVSRTFKAGHSLLIFQTIPREKLEPFIQRTCSHLSEQTGSQFVYSFHVSRASAAFFLVPRDDCYEEAIAKVETDWAEKLTTKTHPFAGG